MNQTVFRDLGRRMNQTVLIGVTGPVRTGKSTFVKRFMEQLVLPNMDDADLVERTRDELPQSSTGRTIMTSEPKFVPEEAVAISPDGATHFYVRLIDNVGYIVPGAIGSEEDGQPRMVMTPWYDEAIPMAQAAEVGTKKVMDDHATVGIVVTTDGSITDLEREAYLTAETQAIEDMQATGKPFIVLVNSSHPDREETKRLAENLRDVYQTAVIPVDCRSLTVGEISEILQALLEAFPVNEFRFYLPKWITMLPDTHPIKEGIISVVQNSVQQTESVGESANVFQTIGNSEIISGVTVEAVNLGDGTVTCRVAVPETLFYRTISEQTGLDIDNEGDLLSTLTELASVKQAYDQIKNALDEVQATGYGIVLPTSEQMQLETPQIIRKGGNYALRLKANAPSIHMIRADIETEVSPIVGDENQAKELSEYLLAEYDQNKEKFWESKLFGKSLYELVSNGLNGKLTQMPENSRYKLRSTLSKIANEGANGMICILY